VHIPGTGDHPSATEPGTGEPKTVGEHLQKEPHTGVAGEHRRSSSSSSVSLVN
jgi:hypothetical protein